MSTFWAEKAANNRNKLAPGTSKWIAHQLGFIQDQIISATESGLFTVQNHIDDLHSFVASAVNNDIDAILPLPTRDTSGNGDVKSTLDTANTTRGPSRPVTDSPPASKSRRLSLDTTNKETGLTVASSMPPSVSPSRSTNYDNDATEPFPNSTHPQRKTITQLPSPVTLHSTKLVPSHSSKSPPVTFLPQSTPLPSKIQDLPTAAENRTVASPDIFRDIIRPSHTNDAKEPTQKTEFQPTSDTKDPTPQTEPQPTREILDNGQDDSFQAIRTAIRKSIAEKRKSVNARGAQKHISGFNSTISNSTPAASTESNPPLLHSSSSKKSTIEDVFTNSKTTTSDNTAVKQEKPKSQDRHESRISQYRTPKRSSIYVSLPSREPITIPAVPTNRKSSILLKQLRLTDKLETALKQETADQIPVDSFSPVKIPKILDTTISKDPSTSKIPTLKRSLISVDLNQKDDKAGDVDKSANSKMNTPDASLTPFSKVKDIEGRRVSQSRFARTPDRITKSNSVKSTAKLVADSKETGSLSRQRQRIGTSISSHLLEAAGHKSKSRSRSVSPVRSSNFNRTVITKNQGGTGSLSRSRSTSPSKISKRSRSPTLSSKSPTKSLQPISSPSPFTDPSSRKQSTFMLPTSASVAKDRVSKTQSMKLDVPNTKNRFLTTNLNGSSPVFKPKSSNLASKSIVSPIKRELVNLRDLALKKAITMESIPHLQKRSYNDVSDNTTRPKQKVSLKIKHDSKRPELVLNKLVHQIPTAKESTSPPKLPLEKVKRDTQKEREAGSSDRTIARKNVGNAVALPEAARGNFSRQGTKKRKPNGEISSTILGANGQSKVITDPKTPKKGHDSGNGLPDIPSDDDDEEGNKQQKILKDWANTPEIHKTFMEQKHIDPGKVFGEVHLEIDDVFESRPSKIRGRQSPDISPINPDKRREENAYALEMGYD